MLTFGYKASAEQFSPRDLLEFAVHAENVGFDQIMISDHFQPWRHSDGHAPFSFAWLGALGERTTRAVLGTSVVTPTFRYHPSIVAQAMATLGTLLPWTHHARRRYGRVAERGSGYRFGMAALQGKIRAAQRSNRTDETPMERGAGDVRRGFLSNGQCDAL